MNSKTSFYENLAKNNLTALLEESENSSVGIDLTTTNGQKSALCSNNADLFF